MLVFVAVCAEKFDVLSRVCPAFVTWDEAVAVEVLPEGSAPFAVTTRHPPSLYVRPSDVDCPSYSNLVARL